MATRKQRTEDVVEIILNIDNKEIHKIFNLQELERLSKHHSTAIKIVLPNVIKIIKNGFDKFNQIKNITKDHDEK